MLELSASIVELLDALVEITWFSARIDAVIYDIAPPRAALFVAHLGGDHESDQENVLVT